LIDPLDTLPVWEFEDLSETPVHVVGQKGYLTPQLREWVAYRHPPGPEVSGTTPSP
jgi:hypothetical protein